jgi:hypothetical protein
MTRKRLRADLTELGENVATDWERAVVIALQELAKDWPPTVMLVSMDGGLSVVRKDAYHALSVDDRASGAERQDACVLATIHGIPNDGGGW